MGKRIRIGIPFFYGEEWVAGIYYLQNIAHALNSIQDSLKPELCVLSWKKKDVDYFSKIGYSYLKYLPFDIPYSFAERTVNKISRIIFRKNLIQKKYTNKHLDVIFPYQGDYYLNEVSKKIYWIPDFQDRYFPEFFSKEEVASRKSAQDILAATHHAVIFSSENARKDFFRIYPDSKCRTYVLHFAATHPEYRSLDIDSLKKKYGISGDFFISPNQFWRHKNHLLVLKAILYLKRKGVNVTVAFTGKEHDYRNPEYFDQLKSFVDENGIQEQVKFLGFIDRKDQLKLMSSALAVIQPSLFEGWSTVVEDAKEMNQVVLLSDIDVHREQMDYNVLFFDPKNEEQLGDRIVQILHGNFVRTTRNYGESVKKFGLDFINIIRDVTGK